MADVGAPAPRWEVWAELVPPQLDSTVSGVCGCVGKCAGASLRTGVTESVATDRVATAIGATGAASAAGSSPTLLTVSDAAAAGATGRGRHPSTTRATGVGAGAAAGAEAGAEAAAVGAHGGVAASTPSVFASARVISVLASGVAGEEVVLQAVPTGPAGVGTSVTSLATVVVVVPALAEDVVVVVVVAGPLVAVVVGVAVSLAGPTVVGGVVSVVAVGVAPAPAVSVPEPDPDVVEEVLTTVVDVSVVVVDDGAAGASSVVPSVAGWAAGVV